MIAQVVSVRAATADEFIVAVIDPNFGRRGVAEEAERAGSASVGAGLEDADEVAHFGVGQFDIARENVERRAERAHDFNFFAGRIRRTAETIHNGNRIIPFDGLAEVSGGGQMMMHAAIEDQEFFLARNF